MGHKEGKCSRRGPKAQRIQIWLLLSPRLCNSACDHSTSRPIMPSRFSRRSLLYSSSVGAMALMIGSVRSTFAAVPEMKITGLKAWQPPTPGSPPDWRTQLGQIVVEVQTESGLSGIGVGGGGAASIHVIQTVLRDLLLGRDASAVEELHRAMNEHTQFYGRKGLVEEIVGCVRRKGPRKRDALRLPA